ncbi:MAG: hypothetical protein ACYDAE_02515 [Steroidobacteraceae bacterium]
MSEKILKSFTYKILALIFASDVLADSLDEKLPGFGTRIALEMRA